MPQTRETIEGRAAPPPLGDVVRKPKLVCVDDEPLILEILRRMVRMRGLDWDVETFADSTLAWDYLRGGDVDVVVTDVTMPGLSGPELVRLLRDNEATRDTPVVVLTGMDEASLKRQVLDLGATDLLAKPIQPDDLLARLQKRTQAQAMPGRAQTAERAPRAHGARTDAPAPGLADRDHLASGQGRRVSRRTNRQPRAARRPLQPDRCPGARPAATICGDAVPVRSVARSGQDRDSRRDPSQAGTADRRRAADRPDSLRDRGADPERAETFQAIAALQRGSMSRRNLFDRRGSRAADGAGNCRLAPRTLGRRRLSARAGRRKHSSFGAHHGHRRRL